MIFSALNLSISDFDREERRVGERPAGPAPCPSPGLCFLLSSCSEMCLLAPSSPSGQFLLKGHIWELLGHHVSASLWAVFSTPRYFSHSLSGPGARTPGFPACLMVQGCSAGLQRIAKLVSFLLRGEGLLPGLGGVRNPRWVRGGGTVAPGAPAPRPLPPNL